MNLEDDLLTTVVGSYPAIPSKKTLSSSYFSDKDPFLESIKDAVDAQLDAGIDLISDGQTRGGMIDIFSRGLRGYRIKEKVEIVQDIDFTSPITLDDQIEVKKMISDDVGLKGIITGPFTLVKNCINNYYEDEKDAVMDTAEALSKEAGYLSDICDVVQVDEPFLSIEYEDYAKEAIEMILDVEIPTALHVCGDTSDIIENLIEYKVDILDHEFTKNPSLFDIYRDLDFPQRLAPGVISTSSTVENVNEITDRINKAVDYFGIKTIIDPDCGFRNLPPKIAFEKLKNMVEARDVVLNERS